MPVSSAATYSAPLVTSPASIHHTPTLEVFCQPHAASSIDNKICLGSRPSHNANFASPAYDASCDSTFELLHTSSPTIFWKLLILHLGDLIQFTRFSYSPCGNNLPIFSLEHYMCICVMCIMKHWLKYEYFAGMQLGLGNLMKHRITIRSSFTDKRLDVFPQRWVCFLYFPTVFAWRTFAFRNKWMIALLTIYLRTTFDMDPKILSLKFLKSWAVLSSRGISVRTTYDMDGWTCKNLKS